MVRLSGVTVDNEGTPFGLRVAAPDNAGSVRIATAPFPADTDLTVPQTVNDFRLLALA
jgi:hypothetical protein